MSGLGEIIVGLKAIYDIVQEAEEIVETANEIMEGVKNILKVLREASEGEGAITLQELGERLQKVFTKLVDALRTIFKAIKDAMDQNEKTDREGAAELKAAIV